MSNYQMTFEEALTGLNGFNKYHAYRFGKISRLNEPDDFESIGQVVIWKCLQTYKFVCPICDKQFKNFESYLRHPHNQQRVKIPKFSLKSYIKLRILSKFQACIKREVAQKRTPKSSFVSASEIQIGRNNQDLQVLELIDVIEYLLKSFDEVEKQVIRLLQLDYSTSEIILEMEEIGLRPNFVRGALKKFRRSFKNYFDEKLEYVA